MTSQTSDLCVICELLIANSRSNQKSISRAPRRPQDTRTGVKTTVLTQAWIFANTFSRIRKSSTRISTEMHGKQTLTSFLALHAFTRDLTFFLTLSKTARSHRFRPPGNLAKIFQHLNPKNSGQNTLFLGPGQMVRMRCSAQEFFPAVLRSKNHPTRKTTLKRSQNYLNFTSTTVTTLVVTSQNIRLMCNL